MSFNSNTSQNTVVYSSPTWDTKVLANNLELGATISTTAGMVEDFDIALGKYERVVGNVSILYNSNNTEEFKFRFQNVDSSNACVDTILNYAVVSSIGDVIDDNVATNANLIGGSADQASPNNNTGQGAIIKLDAGSDDLPCAASIQFVAIGNEGKQGTLSFQAVGYSGTPDLLAGSYITYKRF